MTEGLHPVSFRGTGTIYVDDVGLMYYRILIGYSILEALAISFLVYYLAYDGEKVFQALFGDSIVSKGRIVAIALPFALIVSIPLFLLRSSIEENARRYNRNDT